MSQLTGTIDDFGLDTRSLAGPLAGKLAAVRAAGFTQVMLDACDVSAHPGGVEAAVAEVKASGLRVIALQALRDYEGLAGHAHAYKTEVARSMLELCTAVGAEVLLVAATTSVHAVGDLDAMARDLRKLAMLAVPKALRIAYAVLPGACRVRDVLTAWEVVARADAPNLGIGVDALHVLATDIALDDLDLLDPQKIFLVQLSDFLWTSDLPDDVRAEDAPHLRVFPGEGVHGERLAALVRRLDGLGVVK